MTAGRWAPSGLYWSAKFAEERDSYESGLWISDAQGTYFIKDGRWTRYYHDAATDRAVRVTELPADAVELVPAEEQR